MSSRRHKSVSLERTHLPISKHHPKRHRHSTDRMAHIRAKSLEMSPLIEDFPSFGHQEATSKRTSNERLEKIRISAEQRNLRIRMVRIAKEFITAEQKNRRETKYIDKFRKYNIRNNKTQYIDIKKSWLSVYMFLGSVFVLKKKTENKKRLRERSESRLKWLYSLLKCAGRICIILKANRKKRSMAFFKVHLVCRMDRWVRNTRNLFTACVVDVCENALTSDIMFSLMDKFIRNIVRSQRSLKELIKRKAYFYKVHLDKWNKIELSLSKKTVSQPKLFKTAKASIAGTSTIPEEVKIYYIREFVRQYVREYNHNCIEYFKRIVALKSLTLAEKEKTGMFNHKFQLVKLPKPSLPLAKHMIGTEELKNLVRKAMGERSLWNSMLNHMDDKIRVSRIRNDAE